MKMKTFSILGVFLGLTMMSAAHASHDELITYGGRAQNCHTDRLLCTAHAGQERRIIQCHANVANDNETSSCTQEIKGCSAYVTCETRDLNGRVTSSYEDSCR